VSGASKRRRRNPWKTIPNVAAAKQQLKEGGQNVTGPHRLKIISGPGQPLYDAKYCTICENKAKPSPSTRDGKYECYNKTKSHRFETPRRVLYLKGVEVEDLNDPEHTYHEVNLRERELKIIMPDLSLVELDKLAPAGKEAVWDSFQGIQFECRLYGWVDNTGEVFWTASSPVMLLK